MKKLYHGSIFGDIDELQPRSKLYGEDDSKVVYLSGNLPYSLFYIWDENKVGSSYKYVTCGLKNGVVYYEEQFEGQLKSFYEGVSGWIYVLENSGDFLPVDNREDMWYCKKAVCFNKRLFVEDVYKEIERCIQEGTVVVYSSDEEHKQALFQWQQEYILKNDLLDLENTEESKLYQKYFSKVWLAAKEKTTQ